MTPEQMAELKSKIVMIRENAKISQIMVSRIVKGAKGGGDVFISMTANFGHPTDEGGESEMLSLEDAKIAAHLLGKEVNVVAHEHAAAGGIITSTQMESCVAKIKGNFNHLVTRLGEKNER
jgi:hypothetical protein